MVRLRIKRFVAEYLTKDCVLFHPKGNLKLHRDRKTRKLLQWVPAMPRDKRGFLMVSSRNKQKIKQHQQVQPTKTQKITQKMNPADQQNFLDQWIALLDAHFTTRNGALKLRKSDIGSIQAFQKTYQKPYYKHYGVQEPPIIQDREFGKRHVGNVNLCKKELQDALRQACLVVRES